MSAASPAGCARCGTILGPHFRFCPECALPVSGDGVMSTEIAELRRRVEAAAGSARTAGWTRYLVPTLVIAMLAFVVVLGLFLFNGALLNRLLPPPDESRRPVAVPHVPRWMRDWILVPPGTFPYDDPAKHIQGQVPYAFWIGRHEVPNSLWLEYLTAERKRIQDLRLWQESFPRNAEGWRIDADGNAQLAPERRSYPVTNVSPVAIAEFCVWLTKRLGEPGFEIRMPTQLEWEYAARGNKERRKYTWGNDDVLVDIPQSGGNTRFRAGILSASYEVDNDQLARDDRSPFDVVAMGTNVSEWTLVADFDERPADTPEREIDESLATDGLRDALEKHDVRVAWRGASFACDLESARRLATGWSRTLSEARAQNADVGVRLVKVKASK